MSLTNFELITLCQFYNISLNGVYMKDELPSKNIIGNYIINLDSSSGGGTHWCCFIETPKNECLYFDSFGCVPPEEVSKFIRGKYGFNNWIIQDLSSHNCGFFCLGLLNHIKNDISNGSIYDKANNYINLFKSNTKLNDTLLKQYFSTFLKPYKNCDILIKKLLKK